jgi:hypothetical protein
MIIPLRQSTSRVVRVGSFVDATDGVTPETGVTLGAADQAEIMKAGGGASVDIASNTWTAVTGADGWYDLTLSTTDTNTVGDLLIVVQDASLCLPVLVRCTVIEEAVYDKLYESEATGPAQAGDAMDLVTDAVDSNALAATALTDIENGVLDAALSGHTTGGTVGASLNLLDDIESDISTVLGFGAPPAVSAIADAVWDELIAGHAGVGSTGEALAAAASGGLTQQQVRDALKLAPTGGSPAAGSVDQHLDDLLTNLAALNDLSSADIQAALTAQGYTVARAGNLDNLNVAVSTLATAAALAAVAADMTTTRKIMTNRIHVDSGTGALTIYDDDDSTPLLTANIWSNVAGSTAYAGTSAIARRDKLA